MLTSKQRSNLRSIAAGIEPITQVGKLGINESLIEGLDKAIEKRELIKVTVLENSDLIPKQAGFEIAEKLGCKIHMYDTLGHAAYEEAPDFNQLIYDFLID